MFIRFFFFFKLLEESKHPKMFTTSNFKISKRISKNMRHTHISNELNILEYKLYKFKK